MKYTIKAPRQLNASINLPASKSISNRELVINAMAGCKLQPHNLSDCDDTEVIIAALRDMPDVINIKAAGTAMRFMTAYLSATPGEHTITGTERMQNRPIAILVDALRYLGADIQYEKKEGYPPLHIVGKPLEGGHLEVVGNISSQYISALLMIGPILKNGLELKLTGEIASRPYIDLTLWTMQNFGASAEWTDVDTITVKPQPYSCVADYTIENDWSASSYWYEMMALNGTPDSEVRLEGLFDSSKQGDSVVKYIFSLLGVKSEFENRDVLSPVKLKVQRCLLPRFDYDFSGSPDLAQTIVVACCALGVKFKFTGLASLKIKETDRIEALKKELKKVGGASYLAQLTQKVGSAANVEFHAKIIAQKYVQRELIRSATEIQKRSYDESTDVTELIGYAEGEIFKVAEGHVKRSVQSSKDILARALMQIEEASKNTSAFSGVPSGFMALDRVTLGWQLSDLIIVAARPSMGKTAFVLSMARNMAVDHEQGVAFFSLEMSSVQLMMRLIIAETGLSGNDVKSGRLTPEQWRHLESATKPLGTAPLFIDDTPALSVFEFRSKARRLKIHNDIKIIIIDYLQLMTGNQDTKGNREQEVAFISRTLKAIAKELNVPMIALSQLSRATEMRGGSKRPQLSDLRESGAIEQDADIVAFIHRPEYYGINQDENGMPTAGMAEIILAKHRNGAVCDVNLRFLKEQARFADVEDSMLPPAQAAESQQAYDDYASGSNSQPGTSGLGAAMGGEFDVNRSTKIDDEAPF